MFLWPCTSFLYESSLKWGFLRMRWSFWYESSLKSGFLRTTQWQGAIFPHSWRLGGETMVHSAICPQNTWFGGECPPANNALEGLFSDLKAHSGISKEHRKKLLDEYIKRHYWDGHRRRNIRPPATTDQALRAARPKGRPRACEFLCKWLILLRSLMGRVAANKKAEEKDILLKEIQEN